MHFFYQWIILMLLIGNASCSAFAQTREVRFDETFTLRPDETVKTKDGKLKVRLKGVGRTISEAARSNTLNCKFG